MICPNCGKTVPDDEMFCSVCGAALKSSKEKSFVVNIPQTAPSDTAEIEAMIDAILAEETEEAEAAEAAEQTADEPADAAPESEAQPDEDDTQQDPQPPEAEQSPAPDTEKSGETETDAPVTQKAPVKRTVRPRSVEKEKNKKTYLAIKLVSLFCAAVIIVLSVLSVKTDIFKYDPNKPLALTGLSQEQTASFEQHASGLTALFENGYSSSKAVLEDLLPMIQPDSDNGLYAAFFEKKQPTTDEQDPAGRYTVQQVSEMGETVYGYNYSVVAASDIEKIAKGLGIEAFHDANDTGCYFYDGYYYFAPSADAQSGEKTVLMVEDSKRTQSGDYYITCGLYPEGTAIEADGTYSEISLAAVYFLVRLEQGEDEINWTVLEVSDKPLIGPSSSSEAPTGGDGDDPSAEIKPLSFEMAREKISVETSDGEIYANYVVEYPVFDTEGVTQTAINQIYTEMIESYKAQAKKADKLYASYLKKGKSKDDLPLYTHVSATAVYNENGRFSLVERTAQYVPEADVPDEETTVSGSYTAEPAEEQPQAVLMSTEYEAYTFELDSGDFVKKDEVLGKDYILTQQLLYKTYYLAKNPVDTEDGDAEENIPPDTDGIGEAIYSSAWALTRDGVLFCYKNADGALDRVILPYDEIEG